MHGTKWPLKLFFLKPATLTGGKRPLVIAPGEHGRAIHRISSSHCGDATKVLHDTAALATANLGLQVSRIR